MSLVLSVVGCNQNVSHTEETSITKEEAYALYYNTISKFVPELMKEPQECDIDITARDEVTFANEHFSRNTTVKIKSQVIDDKLQYYLLNEFPEANKINFYCIDDNKFYTMSSKSNEKGTLKEWNTTYIRSFLFPYLNTPLFPLEAISSFTVKSNGSDTEATFIINGDNMEFGFGYRVMEEILPSIDDTLDSVKIIFTVDKDGVPKTMSTEMSMSLLNDNNDVYAKKTLNMDFMFNNLDNVDYDLQSVISQYAHNNSSSN